MKTAMSREISISFALNAALKSGFTAAFQNASASARNVAGAVREMEKSATGRLGQSMISQREKIKGLSESLRSAKSTLFTLQNQAQAAGGATTMLARQIEQASQRVNNLSSSLQRQIGYWKNTVAEAATAAGSVRGLSEEYDRLAGKIERSKRLSGLLHANQNQAQALASQRADLQGRLLSTAATTASVALPVKLAISAEDTFADLRKVMDDADEDTLQQVFADAQEMSSRTGKSFEDVVAIMTAAAQAGLGKTREELLGVADQAVKMSIAWGVSAEQAGKSMATWQAAMGMTSEQARHTGDVINALSNAMNAEAGEINQIFTRLGPMMKGSGIATQDIAALATAFKAAGAEVEVSGTAMKNFVKVMAAGSSGLTDDRKAIYKYLQIDPDQLQKELFTDSKSAILRVLEALKNVNPEELNSISSQLFGEESVAAISPLIGQLEQLKKAYEIANGDVDNSVDEEYANRMKTTATAISQMTQTIRNLGINAGKTLLPVVRDVANGITTLAGGINGLVQRFPRLASVAMTAGAGIAAFAIAGLGLGLVLNTARTGLNSITGLFLRMSAAGVTAAGSTGLFGGVTSLADKSAKSFAANVRSMGSASLWTAAKTGTLSAGTAAFGAASRMAGAGARFFAGGLRSILIASGVGALLVGLGFGISLLIDNWDAVVAAMGHAWGWVTDTWGRLGVFFSELGKNLLAIFPGIWADICSLAVNARDSVLGVWNSVTGFFASLWSGIASGASYVWQNVASLAAWAFDGVATVWQGAVEFFTGIASGVYGVFVWAVDSIAGIWHGFAEFFGGIWQSIADMGAGVWQWLVGLAGWAFDGVAAIWNGALEFFAGIVNGISDLFGRLFGWLRENFAWVFDTIDAIGSVIGKITGGIKSVAGKVGGAISDAWNTAFGKEKPAAAEAAQGKTDMHKAAANPRETPATPVIASARNKPLTVASEPVQSQKPGQSYSQFMDQEEAAKKQGTKKGGGGSRAAGGASGRATGRTSGNSGPVTIVSLAGDNTRPQTVFIPASQSSASIAANARPMTAGNISMPAVQAAQARAREPRILPQTPGLIAKKAKAPEPSSINIDLKQNFELMSSDPGQLRRVMESLKPDFEALVRRALEKIDSDRRRTAFSQ